jgi:hypothetical protein
VSRIALWCLATELPSNTPLPITSLFPQTSKKLHSVLMGLSPLEQVQHKIAVIKLNSGPGCASKIIVIVIINIRNIRKYICTSWKRKLVILGPCQVTSLLDSEGGWLMNWEIFGRKPILAFAWKDSGKPHNTSVRIVSTLSKTEKGGPLTLHRNVMSLPISVGHFATLPLTWVQFVKW